jgi:hypothetical protein
LFHSVRVLREEIASAGLLIERLVETRPALSKVRTAARRRMSVATTATLGVRSGSVAFGATRRKTWKSLDLPNWSERARSGAVTLQAGGHRFDPDTLHSTRFPWPWGFPLLLLERCANRHPERYGSDRHTATTSSRTPSPSKSSGFRVYSGRSWANAVAAITRSKERRPRAWRPAARTAASTRP